MELLDESDIWRILPFYFYDYRLKLRAKTKENTDEEGNSENIVIRNGKKYRKVTAGKAKWADNIF